MKISNSNPFKDTDKLRTNTDKIYDEAFSRSNMMFKESQIWNPVGPPSMNTGDFNYLSSYANAKKQAEGMHKSFYAPGTPNNRAPNCWTKLQESKAGLGKSGLPSLTDKRLGQ